MVLITEELVRKKSEHNECVINTLEELSLHQEDIEKIEHIHNWCRNLQILLLQGNLISRIENLYKLKSLQYLNLAINNIEIIENLEKLESLEKLDLTLNFIGNLESVCTLKNNIHLKSLYLTGNPCVDFTGYRDYVIAQLTQIDNLDNREITRSDRLKALQVVDSLIPEIKIEQEKYVIFRKTQRLRQANLNYDGVTDEEFWKTESEHCPEIRIEMTKRQRRAKNKSEEKKDKYEVTRELKFFAKDGRPYNINQSKLKFRLDDNPAEIVFDVAIYKHLDSSWLNVDVQPNYVRIVIKNKILQIALPEEVCTDKSAAQRSQTTGNLVITMPKLKPKFVKPRSFEPIKNVEINPMEQRQRREYLEIGPDKLTELCNIMEKIDDHPEVPPLE